MIPQGGLRPPPGGSLHSLATEKFEFRVIALERDFFDLLEICSKPEILYFPDPRGVLDPWSIAEFYIFSVLGNYREVIGFCVVGRKSNLAEM